MSQVPSTDASDTSVMSVRYIVGTTLILVNLWMCWGLFTCFLLPERHWWSLQCHLAMFTCTKAYFSLTAIPREQHLYWFLIIIAEGDDEWKHPWLSFTNFSEKVQCSCFPTLCSQKHWTCTRAPGSGCSNTLPTPKLWSLKWFTEKRRKKEIRLEKHQMLN